MSPATVEVWRVEDRRRRGPYATSTRYLPWAARQHLRRTAPEWYGRSVAGAAGAPVWGGERTPMPEWDDLGDAERLRLHFGCPSLEAAVEWFGLEALRQMATWGFHLRRLEVPREHVCLGKSGKQCAFRREAARELEVVVDLSAVAVNPQ